MEARRTLALTLAIVGPNGGSATTGGPSFGGRMMRPAARRDRHPGECTELSMRGNDGYTKKWTEQKVLLIEAAITAVDELGDALRSTTEGARLAGRMAALPHLKIVASIVTGYWTASDSRDLRGNGMALWI